MHYPPPSGHRPTVALLPPEELNLRAEDEIARARRYQRPLSVLVARADDISEQAILGGLIRRVLRRWDIVGRLTTPLPLLVALLPETDLTGAAGARDRLAEIMPDVQMGYAACPEDGQDWPTLLYVAQHLRRAPTTSSDDMAA